MDAERLFTETKQGFDFYHRNFGVRYPFGKYDQLFVPEFNAGAMENAGAVTFLEDYVFRSRVTRLRLRAARRDRAARDGAHVVRRPGHHALVGRPVAERVVRHLGQSVLCQAEATEYTEAWTTFANVEKSWAYRQDQLPSTHPVAADIPDLQAVEVNFDGITYAKGASRAQAARRLRRAGAVPGRAAQLLHRARLGQRHLRRPARRAGGGVRARPVAAGARSGCRPPG